MTDPTGFIAGDENGGSAVFADGKKKEKEEPRYICVNGSGQQVHCLTGQLVNNGSTEQKECKGKDNSGGCSQSSVQGTVVWTRAGSTVALGNGVQMVPRDDWAKYPADPDKMTDSNGQFSIISLHHTGSQNTPEDVETLHRWKISPTEKFGRTLFGQTYKGQGDISYHFLIDANGVIYEGRSLEYKCACVFSYNNKNIGIAFLGDYSQSKLNDKQMNAAITLIDQLNIRYGNHSQNALYGSLTIYTHANFDSKKHSELRGAEAQIKQIKSLAKEHWTRD